MKSIVRRIDPYLLLLFALSLPALSTLFAAGYFYEAHDGRHSVFYQVMFDASIRSGALWPRWAMHHLQGYGYPTFIILAPMGFYLGELWVLLGAGFTLAARLSWATGVLLSGWGLYRLLLLWTGAPPRQAGGRTLDAVRLAAVAGGLLFVYAPYHLLDIYVRGALNESLLFAWLPWLVLAFDRLLLNGAAPGWKRRLAVAMLVLAGTWLTHSFAVLAVTPLLVALILFRLLWGVRRASGWRGASIATALAVAAGIGALLLCAVFLVPLFAESPLLDQQVYLSDTYNYRNHFVYWGQFFSPFWGYGYSDDPLGAGDGMGFQVGLVALVVTLAGLAQVRRFTTQRALFLFLCGATLAILAAMTPLSRPLWDAAPTLAVIQFPWRLLVLASFTLCAAAGLALFALLPPPDAQPAEVNRAGGALLALAVLAILASAGYSDPALQPVEPWREDGRAVFRFEEQFPDMIAYSAWTKEPFTSSPMSDDYANPDYAEVHGRTASLERLSILSGEGEVLEQRSAGSRFGGRVLMQTGGVVRANLLYFPGWHLTIDGAAAPLRVSDPYGLVEFDLPAGEHEVEVRMGSTPARRAGTLVSWSMLAVAAALFLWPQRGSTPEHHR